MGGGRFYGGSKEDVRRDGTDCAVRCVGGFDGCWWFS